MTTARFLVGDVFDRMAELPDNSFDLIVTSPPFLALRSYLPDGHPDKHKEIGSEATPAEFLDTLLALTAEWGRLLAPHGSLAIELGDSYSGSGGAGGDYDEDGWRGGQPRFGGSASRARESRWSVADALWLAGVIDTEGSIIVHRQDRGGISPSYRTDVCVSMMDREVCDRAAEIAGVGRVNQDGRNVYSWHVSAQQARYVLMNIWPYLLIKKRQAMAAIELQRHIEEVRGRGSYSRLTEDVLGYREMIREYVSGLNARGEDRGKYVPTWMPPSPPRIQHPERRSVGWPMSKSLCMIPQLYGIGLSYGINPLTGADSPAGRWRVRNVKAFIRSNPPVGALGDKERPATSYVVVACRARDRWFDLDAVRTIPADTRPRNTNGPKNGDADAADVLGHYDTRTTNPAGAPPRDWWHHVDAVIDACIDNMAGKPNKAGPSKSIEPVTGVRGDDGQPHRHDGGGSVGARGVHLRRALEAAGILTTLDALDISPTGYTGAHYAVFPKELVRLLIDEMAPRRVCVTCGQPSRRIVNAVAMLDGQPLSRSVDASARDKGAAHGFNHNRLSTDRRTLGWSDCGHDDWRPGRILDPFVGSGTTLEVATGMGRDAVGIDLDERNVELARQRVGMFLEVDEPREAAS